MKLSIVPYDEYVYRIESAGIFLLLFMASFGLWLWAVVNACVFMEAQQEHVNAFVLAFVLQIPATLRVTWGKSDDG